MEKDKEKTYDFADYYGSLSGRIKDLIRRYKVELKCVLN